jgi:ribonuclease HI
MCTQRRLVKFNLQYNNGQNHSDCCIYTDSQAAGTSITKPKRQSPELIIRSILECADTMLNAKPPRKLTIEWIPGDRDIEGNERADVEAKRAALDASRFDQGCLKSARPQDIKAAQWRKQWHHGCCPTLTYIYQGSQD